MTAAIFLVVWQGAVRNRRWYCQGWNGLCRGRVSRRSVLMKLLGWWKMVAWRVSVRDESTIFSSLFIGFWEGMLLFFTTWMVVLVLEGILIDFGMSGMFSAWFTQDIQRWRKTGETEGRRDDFDFPNQSFENQICLSEDQTVAKAQEEIGGFPKQNLERTKAELDLWIGAIRGESVKRYFSCVFKRLLVSICLIGCFAWTNEPSKAEINNSGWQKGWWIVDLIVWEVSGEERTIQGGTWICDFPSTIIIEIS